MLVFESFDIRILDHYGTVELLFIQTSLEKECRIRSLSEHKCLPVIARMKMKRITISNGFKKSPKYGIVHIKCLNFLLKPPTKAEYAKLWILHYQLQHQVVTFLLMLLSLYFPWTYQLFYYNAVLFFHNQIWFGWFEEVAKGRPMLLYYIPMCFDLK